MYDYTVYTFFNGFCQKVFLNNIFSFPTILYFPPKGSKPQQAALFPLQDS